MSEQIDLERMNESHHTNKESASQTHSKDYDFYVVLVVENLLKGSLVDCFLGYAEGLVGTADYLGRITPDGAVEITHKGWFPWQDCRWCGRGWDGESLDSISSVTIQIIPIANETLAVTRNLVEIMPPASTARRLQLSLGLQILRVPRDDFYSRAPTEIQCPRCASSEIRLHLPQPKMLMAQDEPLEPVIVVPEGRETDMARYELCRHLIRPASRILEHIGLTRHWLYRCQHCEAILAVDSDETLPADWYLPLDVAVDPNS